jgi:magnesium-protoporphyrin O-methyltransferase
MKASIPILFLVITGSSAFVPATQNRQHVTSLPSSVDDKTEVREYFNTEGFNRWNKIYSESDEVNSVQMDIRTGHDQTIQKILNWVRADGDIKGKTVCDCGCGVGSLAIPLAQMGEHISMNMCKLNALHFLVSLFTFDYSIRCYNLS